MEPETLVGRIRADFPALRRAQGGRPVAYFDGPAGSQVPSSVIDAVAGYLSGSNANTHGAFATSRETDGILATARERMAAFVGARSSQEIAFGANMTSLTYALSRALAGEWGPGDEVVVTELDHQANVAPWRQAAEQAGATVRTVSFSAETGLLDLDQLAGLIGPRTRLVAIGHASNALGTVNDVARVAALARAAGALSFVDAVHSAPHGVIDVQAIGCDFLVCSAYKFFGPHVGILWGRRDLLQELRPFRLPPASDRAPERWETGTLNHEGIAGVAAAVEWIAGLATSEGGSWRDRVVGGMETIQRLERPLLSRLLEGLAPIDAVTLYGPAGDQARTPTVALTVGRLGAREVAERLAGEGIFVWDGDFYASTVIDRLGLRDRGGLVRIGLAPYSTAEEIDRLIAAIGSLAHP